MLREAIATGETVEIARQKACDELGIDSSEAQFEILQVPTKKTFGLFGGNPAKVRVFIEEIEEIKNVDPAQDAADYLQGLLQAMDITDVEIDIVREENSAALKLVGGDIGFIIGHRGETLDALQYLASLVANHVDHDYYRITLDIGNYRAKRMETLQALGKKMANKALKTGRNHSLEPMNPYERRIIHTAVQEVEGAKSWSEGEDVGRHVVIGPVDGERYPKNRYRGGNQRRGGYDNRNRGGYNNRTGNSRSGNYNKKDAGQRPPRQNQQNRPAQGSAFPKRDDPSAPVYGKLEKK